MSEVASIALSLPRLSAGAVVARLKGIGDFLYGDEERTRRSLFFSYACITFYTLMLLNADIYAASCTR